MRGKKPSEEGYLLLWVMFLLAALIISMAVAVPRIRADIQRDREVETMHRGLQYRRAIQLYYKKFRAYPPNIDALVKTNETRFLRKRYTDPMTGKDDWKPIMAGQNKTPLVIGFFGQALAGSGLAGTGPGGVTGASAIGSSFMSGSSSGGGATSGGGSIFSSGPTSPATGTTSGATTGSGLGTTAPGSSGTVGSDSSSGTIGSNQAFGGGGIIGFSPGSEKQSILTYKKKDHYIEWEFLYSPQQDQKTITGSNAGMIGTPASGLNGNGTQPGSGGLFSSPGGTSTTPTAPTIPQP